MGKTMIIVAISLIVIGALFGAGALAAMGFDFSNFSTVAHETNNYDVTQSFSSIEITDTTSKITFEQSPVEICTVVCSEAANRKHSVTVENGTLRITKEDTSKWYENIAFNIGEETVTVYLPDKKYEHLSVTVSTGDVTIPKDFEFRSIRIEGSTSDVVCDADAWESTEVYVSTGDIMVNEVHTGKLYMNASTGKITVKGAKIDEGLRVYTSTGRITLTEVNAGDTSLTTDTGRVSMSQLTVWGELHIETDTGDVKFESSDAEKLFVKTDTGDVKGTLRSDKVFVTQTATGKIRVPKSTTGGICEITTGTGDIEIEIRQ